MISRCFSYHDHGHTYRSMNRAQELPSIRGFNYRYSEVHAAILIAQYSKLSHILLCNKQRYLSLSSHLSHHQRPCQSFSIPSYDTYMLKVINKLAVASVIEVMNSFGISTKNIPSAMNWHCSYKWKHMDFIDYQDASSEAFATLSHYISIPILLEKSTEFYDELGLSISSVLA